MLDSPICQINGIERVYEKDSASMLWLLVCLNASERPLANNSKASLVSESRLWSIRSSTHLYTLHENEKDQVSTSSQKPCRSNLSVLTLKRTVFVWDWQWLTHQVLVILSTMMIRGDRLLRTSSRDSMHISKQRTRSIEWTSSTTEFMRVSTSLSQLVTHWSHSTLKLWEDFIPRSIWFQSLPKPTHWPTKKLLHLNTEYVIDIAYRLH